MSAKPLHFYRSAQADEQIFNELSDRFGTYLEKLEPEQKLALASAALIGCLNQPFVFDTDFYQKIKALTTGGKLELVRALIAQVQTCQSDPSN